MEQTAAITQTLGLPAGTRMGRYELIRRLAIGGMAELYIARQSGIEGFEKIVVLKRVLPNLAADPQFVQMFLSEARIAATLDHPNIAQVTDIGEEGGEYFFAMEYVHGANLLQVLKRSGETRLPRSCALTIVVGVAAGLHYAHEQLGLDGRPLGLVHRDVSPSNVILSHNGAVKLTDFGIARAAARTSVTQQGQFKGKAGYMSPEQCQGGVIDRRSDIFTLGILLYEATTGARAFYAPNDFAILGRIARADYIPPRELDPEYPPQLEAVIAKAMAKDPDDRYETAEQMQLQLEDVAAACGWRLSAVELARHMKSLFGTPAHPHTDIGSMAAPIVPAARVEPTPVEPPEPLVVTTSSRTPWVIAGIATVAAAAAVAFALPAEREGASSDTATKAADAPAPEATVVPVPVPVPTPTPSAEVAAADQVGEPETAGADVSPASGETGETGEPLATPPATESPDEATPSPRPTPKKKKKRKKKKADGGKTDLSSLYPPGHEP